MTNSRLAKSYLEKAKVRLAVLDLLIEKKAYSDVVREAQEVVELAMKATLREVGIEPPKFYDVGQFLLENVEKFSAEVQPSLERLAKISAYLRKERELSFYGDIDFIPTERYTKEDAEKAKQDAVFVVSVAVRIGRPTRPDNS